MMLKPTIFPVKVKVSKLYRREFAKLLQANDDFAKIDAGRESNVDILGMSREEIGAILVNEPSFRASQVYRFIYAECGESWKDAIRLPIRIREVLSQTVGADVFRGRVDSRWVSMDGTCKFLIEVNPGRHVECVLIPETLMRRTLCVSSQLGCALSCTFCHTGTQKFGGNLTAGEILRQITAIDGICDQKLTNIVFMGQGEPLLNYNSISKAIKVMTDQEGGLGLSRSKITVSTSGIAKVMPWVAKDLGVNLSVSLHAPRDSLRSQIMSINKTYPLNVLMDACKQFTIESPCATRRITFEYAMLAGVNDSEREAAELVSLIKKLPSPLINLIPFNQWPGSRYKCSPESQIKAFKDYLWSHGLDTTVRKSRGDDIMAACGQLRSLDSASKSNSTSSEGSHTRKTLGPRTINGVQF